MNKHTPPSPTRTARLFRNGRNQAIRIPVEFELPGSEVTIQKEGDRLIVTPTTLSEQEYNDILDSLESFPDFPDVDDSDLPPVRDVVLE